MEKFYMQGGKVSIRPINKVMIVLLLWLLVKKLGTGTGDVQLRDRAQTQNEQGPGSIPSSKKEKGNLVHSEFCLIIYENVNENGWPFILSEKSQIDDFGDLISWSQTK